MVKLKGVMRAKLLSLRKGRILSDEEVRPLMYVPYTSTTTPESPIPPDDDVEMDENGDEEGVDSSNDNNLNEKVEVVMTNLVKQPVQFQSMAPSCKRSDQLVSVLPGRNRERIRMDTDQDNIDDEEEDEE